MQPQAVEEARPGPALREHAVSLADGRKLVLWSLAPERPITQVPIVIASAFARRMDQFASLALYLAHAGFTVVRYDSVDHVGLSDGDIEDFTLSVGLRSLEAAVEWARAAHDAPQVGLIATSLTARLAYDLLPRCDGVAFLATVVGVVDVRATLERVFGRDYIGMPLEELPEHVAFENKRVRSAVFYRDYMVGGWGTARETARALAGASQPVAAFVAERDPWVDAGAVRELFASGHGRRRQVLELASAGHELGVNPAVARAFMVRMTSLALDLAGVDEAHDRREPQFSELVEQALIERRMQRGRAAKGRT